MRVADRQMEEILTEIEEKYHIPPEVIGELVQVATSRIEHGWYRQEFTDQLRKEKQAAIKRLLALPYSKELITFFK